jgi:rod shape-determining protein MreB
MLCIDVMHRKLKLNFLRPIFSSTIGVDLGTSSTRICVAGRGVVVNEPSVVVRGSRHRDGAVVAGSGAREFLGRTSTEGTAVCPVKNGVVSDFLAAEDMLRCFLRRIVGRWEAPSLVFSVPIGATEAERRAVQELAEAVGARKALLVDAPIAAAIGAGLPVDQAIGSMIVDAGAGKTEAAVLNLGRVVLFQSIRIGGEALDRAIATKLRAHHGMLVGNRTAEAVKMRAAYVKCGDGGTETSRFATSIRGLDLSSGLPAEIDVDGSDIAAAIMQDIEAIVTIVVNTARHLPLEISSDIAHRGIIMTGGSSALPGLQQHIGDEVGIPTVVVEDYEQSVIFGLNLIVQNIEKFRPFLYSMY